ncbi:MAG: arylesterase [Pseudomonadota bacterium]
MPFARNVAAERYALARAICKGAATVLLCAATMVAATGAAAAEAPLRLIAFGDSLTHGFGLDQGDGFVPQLDAWLAGQGHPQVEVINMGVSGDTTAGGKARLGWALADGADALILELGGNDMLRGVDPAVSRENLRAMLQDLAARDIPVLLAGLEAPLNYGPEFKAAFDGMYAELSAEFGTLLYPSFVDGLVGQPDLMQSDGIHPNKDGVARIVEGIGPLVLDLIAQAQPKATQ